MKLPTAAKILKNTLKQGFKQLKLPKKEVRIIWEKKV